VDGRKRTNASDRVSQIPQHLGSNAASRLMIPHVTSFAHRQPMAIDMNRINPLTEAAIGAAIKVHRALGPGLLESAYSGCLVFELQRSGMKIRSNVPLPIQYDDVQISVGYRLDIIVEDFVVLELKSVNKLAEIHTAQLLTYLKLSGYPVGLLMNFNVTLLKSGVKRLINPHPAER
jgi:GxxExxY protein